MQLLNEKRYIYLRQEAESYIRTWFVYWVSFQFYMIFFVICSFFIHCFCHEMSIFLYQKHRKVLIYYGYIVKIFPEDLVHTQSRFWFCYSQISLFLCEIKQVSVSPLAASAKLSCEAILPDNLELSEYNKQISIDLHNSLNQLKSIFLLKIWEYHNLRYIMDLVY